MSNPESNQLSTQELERLDTLLSGARRFHYLTFLLSGISLVLSSFDAVEGFKLPIGDMIVPRVQTIVAIYLAAVVLTMGSERLFVMASPWLGMDTRRPPFAWIALGTEGKTTRSILPWLLVPVLLCAVSTALCLDRKDVTGFSLSWTGALAILSPQLCYRYWRLIQTREDHRGGPVTLSVWLLYVYRLVRGLSLIAFFFAPVIAIVPKWRQPVWRVALPVVYTAMGLYIVRAIAGFSFIYRRIDRLGKRFSFPTTSEHYK